MSPSAIVLTVLRSGGDDSQLQFPGETEGQNSAFVGSLAIFLPTAKMSGYLTMLLVDDNIIQSTDDYNGAGKGH